jgi:hypothetical protein
MMDRRRLGFADRFIISMAGEISPLRDQALISREPSQERAISLLPQTGLLHSRQVAMASAPRKEDAHSVKAKETI